MEEGATWAASPSPPATPRLPAGPSLHRHLSVGGLGFPSLAVCSPADRQELSSVKLEKMQVGNPQMKNVLLSVSDQLLNKTTVRSKQKPLDPPNCWDPTLSS